MRPLRILIAEDEAVIALLLEEVLSAMGHEVCANLTTAEDAVAAAAEHEPDLLIIDAGLGDGSGIDAAAQIHAARPVAHIFMTGNVAAVRSQCPHALILEKPFHEADLQSAIERAIHT
jgi:CheY-like chemotaxis protein